MQTSHKTPHQQSGYKEEAEVGLGYRVSKPAPQWNISLSKAPPPKGSASSSNNTIQQVPKVQTREPVGDSSHLNLSMPVGLKATYLGWVFLRTHNLQCKLQSSMIQSLLAMSSVHVYQEDILTEMCLDINTPGTRLHFGNFVVRVLYFLWEQSLLPFANSVSVETLQGIRVNA